MSGVATPRLHGNKIQIYIPEARRLALGLFALAFLAYTASALPAITFIPPTLNTSVTTGSNWVYVNTSSSEPLNQSLLEWGNQSGFTNITMANSSMASWYWNMTDLADWAYNYTVWAQNTTGAWNQTEMRVVNIDTIPPYSLYACQDLTIENGSYALAQNVSSAGTCFNILANNITLDGAGRIINYSQSAVGYAISDSGGYDNITIKNLNIVQGNASVANSAYAIYGNGMMYSNITNNTITTSSGLAIGIALKTSSNSNNVSNNNITTLGLYSLGIYLSSSDSNTISTNNINTSGTQGFGINLDDYGASNTLSGNTVRTSGSEGYGIYLYSAGISNYLADNNITSSGNNGYGIYLAQTSRSNITNNILNATNSYAIYIDPAATASYYNHTIDTTNTEQGEPIYYYFGNSSIIIENLTNAGQLYVANSANMTIRNVTLDKDGIVFAMTTNSIITNSNITASGSHGVYLYSSSNSNTLSNNTISSSTSAGYGIYIDSSSANNITGGSVTSAQSNDYYLTNASANNNFTNTNFAAPRKIYFYDTSSYFNYNNGTGGNLWLRTNVSGQSYLTRALVNWTNITLQWNDTNSTAGITARYAVVFGLPSTTKYAVYNASAGNQSNPYNLTTDSNGNLPAFTIALNGNTEVKVTDIFPPLITFVSPTWPNNTNTPENWTYINVTLSETGSAAILEWNNGTPANYSMAGSGKNFNLNMSGSTNATYRVFANDTLGYMNVSETRFVRFNVPNYPQYSGPAVNTTLMGASTLFTASWTDLMGLAGYIFSSNNSGSWSNTSYVNFSGTTNTSSATLTLNTTTNTSVGFRFYANNTYGRWNDTGVQIVSVTCVESWTYTAWSSCSGGAQTRTATDAKYCGTTVDRLPLSQSCTNVTTPVSPGNPGNAPLTPVKSLTATPNEVLTKITVNLKNGATGPSISVSKLASAPVTAPSDAKIYIYLSITKSNFTDSDISNATIEFSVNKSWISANNITNVSLARYDGSSWKKLRTDLVSSTASENKYNAYTSAFSYFAILGEAGEVVPEPEQYNSAANETIVDANVTGALKKAPNEKESGLSIWWWILSIIIIVAASIYIYYRKDTKGARWSPFQAKKPAAFKPGPPAAFFRPAEVQKSFASPIARKDAAPAAAPHEQIKNALLSAIKPSVQKPAFAWKKNIPTWKPAKPGIVQNKNLSQKPAAKPLSGDTKREYEKDNSFRDLEVYYKRKDREKS